MDRQLNPYAPPDSDPQRALGPTNWRPSTGLSIIVVAVSWWIFLITAVDKPDEMPLVLVFYVVGPALGGGIGLVKRSCLIPGTVLGATVIGYFLAICVGPGVQNLPRLEMPPIEQLKLTFVVLFSWGIMFGAAVLVVRMVISFIARRIRQIVTPHERTKG
jgi:hypothetical protein